MGGVVGDVTEVLCFWLSLKETRHVKKGCLKRLTLENDLHGSIDFLHLFLQKISLSTNDWEN